MRGEVVRDARPGRARNALVALQVTGSVLLLICAAVFLRSTWAAATVDPGIRTADTVNVDILNEQRRGAILEAVRREPSVASVAASWPGVLGGRAADGVRRTAASVASRPSRTSSSRRNTSASSASISCADAASRRPSGAQAPRWRSCPKASRASCGRAPTPSGRSCGSSRTRTATRGSRTTRRFSRAASSSSASRGMSRASGWAARGWRAPVFTCRSAPRLPGRR